MLHAACTVLPAHAESCIAIHALQFMHSAGGMGRQLALWHDRGNRPSQKTIREPLAYTLALHCWTDCVIISIKEQGKTV